MLADRVPAAAGEGAAWLKVSHPGGRASLLSNQKATKDLERVQANVCLYAKAEPQLQSSQLQKEHR